MGHSSLLGFKVFKAAGFDSSLFWPELSNLIRIISAV